MSKSKRIIFTSFFSILLVFLLTWFSFYDKNDNTVKHQLSDYTRLNGDYSSFNVYDSFNDFETSVLKEGEHIVYLGKPNCPWCQQYIAYYDEVSKETGKKINYFNLENLKGDLKETETGIKTYGDKYQKMYDLIYKFDEKSDLELTTTEDNVYAVYVPIIFKIKDGIITEVVGEVKGHIMGEDGLRELSPEEQKLFINDLKELFN